MMTSGIEQRPESTHQAAAAQPPAPESQADAERVRRAAGVRPDPRPCGGFMIGGNGYMLGSGN
jgi:hypothetical protein